MKRLCARPDCGNHFDPDREHVDTQKYCTIRCGTRDRVRRYRERLKPQPNGGGPGGGNQPMLFSRSAMNRRKPKPVATLKAKQDALFPDDGQVLHATFGGAVEYGPGGSVSDKNRYSVKPVDSSRRPPRPAVVASPEDNRAA